MADEPTRIYVADMGAIEAAYARALHDLDCSETPPGHPLESHEPWSADDLEGTSSWPEFTAALRRRGLLIVAVPLPILLYSDVLEALIDAGMPIGTPEQGGRLMASLMRRIRHG